MFCLFFPSYSVLHLIGLPFWFIWSQYNDYADSVAFVIYVDQSFGSLAKNWIIAFDEEHYNYLPCSGIYFVECLHFNDRNTLTRMQKVHVEL